jgi:hypothetical protein
LLVHHVDNRAAFGSNPDVEAPCDERASRSASELVSASLRQCKKANLPNKVKPATIRGATSRRT